MMKIQSKLIRVCFYLCELYRVESEDKQKLLKNKQIPMEDANDHRNRIDIRNMPTHSMYDDEFGLELSDTENITDF